MSSGDRDTLATIAVYLTPVLVRHARKEMGPYAHDAEDVVQDAFLRLADGTSPAIPERIGPAEWLVDLVREGARKYREKGNRDWGNDGDGPG